MADASTIAAGMYYTLARHAQFEDVVRLLWSPDGTRTCRPCQYRPRCREALAQLRRLPTWNRLQAILPFAAANDGAAFDIGGARPQRPVGGS